jgi:hypothetical protein
VCAAMTNDKRNAADEPVLRSRPATEDGRFPTAASAVHAAFSYIVQGAYPYQPDGRFERLR